MRKELLSLFPPRIDNMASAIEGTHILGDSLKN